MNDKETKQVASRASAWSSTWFFLGIIVVQVLLSVCFYPWLPEQMAAHWNAAGEVDRYLSKLELAILIPGISVIIYILSSILLHIGPRLGSVSNSQTSKKVTNYLLCGTFLFMLAIQLMVIAVAFHLPVDVSFVTTVIVALFCIFLGNYFGKLQRNLLIGIRTPWTIRNDTVWERTHRLGGWLFVSAGGVMLILNFFPPLRLLAAVGPILIVSIMLIIYSYRVDRRLKLAQEQGSSLSSRS